MAYLRARIRIVRRRRPLLRVCEGRTTRTSQIYDKHFAAAAAACGHLEEVARARVCISVTAAAVGRVTFKAACSAVALLPFRARKINTIDKNPLCDGVF